MRKLMGWTTTLIVTVVCALLGGLLQDRLGFLQDLVDRVPLSNGMVWPYLIVVWTLMIVVPMVIMARRRARWRRQGAETRPLADTEPD